MSEANRISSVAFLVYRLAIKSKKEKTDSYFPNKGKEKLELI